MNQIETKQVVLEQPKENIQQNEFYKSTQPIKMKRGEAGFCGPCIEALFCCNLCASCFNNWCFCCRNIQNCCCN
ncbi:unnamed protein product [Brachionus calyciflorus]|uniref:Cysteine-rich transmembrane CYSTM domain-containing protein n=1 Tax=Brachionus calyciflorus TaxID=104777 RepID=A0A814H864_9BILA|nr:unnamed protein product [Brachionus calyciflorus]